MLQDYRVTLAHHWPPGYHILEAFWFLLWGPLRIMAILLQWPVCVLSLTVLFRLCRSSLYFPVSAAIIAFTITAPIFQESLEQTMVDLWCLLWIVLSFSFARVITASKDGSV